MSVAPGIQVSVAQGIQAEGSSPVNSWVVAHVAAVVVSYFRPSVFLLWQCVMLTVALHHVSPTQHATRQTLDDAHHRKTVPAHYLAVNALPNWLSHRAFRQPDQQPTPWRPFPPSGGRSSKGTLQKGCATPRK